MSTYGLSFSVATVVAIFTTIALFILFQKERIEFAKSTTSWEIQSIDTMKYSRDLARENITNSEFDKVIDQQVSQISQLGATHVAIGTPYDPEFIPYLTRWVNSARAHGLNVWFRGNFSGWENWFEYEDITTNQHLEKTAEFITNNPNLFVDGDIFTSCTECENGQLGDPRFNGDLAGFRQFIEDLYAVSSESFKSIGKDVESNFFSMNGDVASLVMDREFSEKIGGIIVVDHYVRDPDKLNSDINRLAEDTGAKIVLGEYGAPIPDIHGEMSETQQAQWVEDSLELLSQNPNLLGINYWVLNAGSTSLLNDDDTLRSAATVLSDYFRPKFVIVDIRNELGFPITNATAISGTNINKANAEGIISIPYIHDTETILIDAPTYKSIELTADELSSNSPIILEKENKNLIFEILKGLMNKGY